MSVSVLLLSLGWGFAPVMQIVETAAVMNKSICFVLHKARLLLYIYSGSNLKSQLQPFWSLSPWRSCCSVNHKQAGQLTHSGSFEEECTHTRLYRFFCFYNIFSNTDGMCLLWKCVFKCLFRKPAVEMLYHIWSVCSLWMRIDCLQWTSLQDAFFNLEGPEKWKTKLQYSCKLQWWALAQCCHHYMMAPRKRCMVGTCN